MASLQLSDCSRDRAPDELVIVLNSKLAEECEEHRTLSKKLMEDTRMAVQSQLDDMRRTFQEMFDEHGRTTELMMEERARASEQRLQRLEGQVEQALAGERAAVQGALQSVAQALQRERAQRQAELRHLARSPRDGPPGDGPPPEVPDARRGADPAPWPATLEARVAQPERPAQAAAQETREETCRRPRCSWSPRDARREGGDTPGAGRAAAGALAAVEAESPRWQEESTEAVKGTIAGVDDLDALTSSAWQLCSLDASVFALSLVYELFPTPVSGFLCWAVEGVQSAKNRGLVYSTASLLHPFNVPLVLDLCWTGGPWALLLLWLFARPEHLKSEVVVIPFMMLLWRATCIGVKYAYFSRMDMLKLRSSSTWRKSMYNFRVLGTGQHFDTLGTICYDWLEELFNSALRCGILTEAAGCFVRLPPVAAQTVWTEVRTLLTSIDDPRSIGLRALFPGASSLGREGRYVDVQKKLGLSDLDAVEAEVAEGRLPVAALAYYLVSTSCRATSKPIFFIGAAFGVGCGFVYPAATMLTGHAAFGERGAEHYFFAIRTWVMGMVFMPSIMFCMFPALDALKRMRLTKALLLVCGDPVVRSETHLAHPLLNVKLSLDSTDDLKAMWLLSQLLGPMYGRGQSLRYGSAILSLSSTVVVCITAVMYYYVHILEHTVSVGIAAEILVFFLSGLFSIVVTTTVCSRVSVLLGHFQQILNRATAAFAFGSGCDTGRDEFVAAAEWVDQSIQLHLASYPVMVAYQPASTTVLSLTWSFSTVLIGMWLVAFQQAGFSVPFFEE